MSRPKRRASPQVDWLPWGAEAFAQAKERDVPIFLSVGYSTCHCEAHFP
jgi:uncharacterized protein YyaL (SSP411 family)